MDCNKEEAIRAKNIAEKKMQNRDFSGALKVAIKAKQLCQDLENISQMIMVCDVHCAAEKPFFGNEKDWYAILKLEQTADEATIKKQYRKFALLLHPDKNKFPGAEAAFKLIGDAQRTLLDQGKRAAYDMKRKVVVNRPAPAAAFRPPQYPSWHPHTATQSNIPNFSGLNSQQQRQPPTQAGFSNGQSTFWTKCPYCTVRYQYYTEVLHRSLRCQTCKKDFVAYDSGAVPQATNMNQSNFPRQGVAQNQSAGRVDHGSQRKFTTENIFTAFTPKAANTSDARTEKANGKRGRKQTVESSKSCDSESSIESEEDVVIDGNGEVLSGKKVGSQVPQNVRRSGRHKQHVSYKENLSDEEDTVNPTKRPKGSGSHCATEEMAEEAKPVHNNQVKEDKKTTDHGNGKHFEASLPNGKNTREASADGIKGKSNPAADDSVSDSKPDPDDENEIQWVSEGLPASCGNFKYGESENVENRLMFSHLIYWEKGTSRDTCKIFPRKGETWALFKNWNIKWKSGAQKYEYEIVEILSDNDEGVGIQVAYLTKVKGFVSVFSPMNKDTFLIPPRDLFRFSHRVPSFALTGKEMQGVPIDSFELDPVSLPEEFFVSKDLKEEGGNGRNPSGSCPGVSETGKPMVGLNNSVPPAFEIPESEFHNFDNEKTKEKFRVGQIWALYGDEDGLPKYYGEIKKINSHPVFKIHVRWLFPSPSETTVKCRATGSKNEYTIVPRRGEIWALYRNWTRDIKCSDLENWEYDIVQVLEENCSRFKPHLPPAASASTAATSQPKAPEAPTPAVHAMARGIKGIDPCVNCLIGKPSSKDKKCSNQVILNSEVRQWAEDLQRQEGDSLQDDYVSDLASYAPVSLKRNDMQDLRSIWESWDSNKKLQFYQTYGDIPYLLYVEVDDELLRALVQFWNPGYNCFTLNKEDLVPTIEEYTTLLHIDGVLENRIYSKSIKTQPFRVKLAKIAGVREEWVVSRTKQKGESEGIAWTNIKELIQSHPDVKLPKKINPVSVILAETFRSLNACRKLGGGRFSGCTQLLYVWIRSHFWRTEKVSYRRFNTDYSPLKEFLEQEWPKEIKKDMWINAFRNLQSNDIVWRAPWQIQREFFYKCGDYNWIMLLGLWGGIGYAPLLVIRQYEGRQFVPVTAGLQSSEFAFHSKNYKRSIMEAVTAWKTIFCIRAKAAKEMLTPDYEEWRSSRKNENIPLPDQKEDISMEDRIKVVPSEIEILRAEFKAEREGWSKELEQMRQDKAMLGVDIDFHSSQCAMLRKDKEKVDDEFRALQKNYQELYKSRKVSGSSQATIQMTRELNIEKSRVEHLKGKNSHLLKSLEKGKQKMKDFDVDRRERIIKSKAEHREIMNEMQRERDRAKDLEEMKNDIFDKFEGEKNIMFKGFESEMNQLIAELEVRGQKMEEYNIEKEKWELERKNFNTRLEVEHEVASNWMQRCRNKNVQIQKLNQRTQEARTKLEEDLDQSRNKNSEFNDYILQLEESLFQEKVRLGPNDLKESNEENASLRRRIRDLEKILHNCQVRITELEQTLEGTNEQWQKSTDFYMERSEERSNMVFEAMVQMSEVARYVGELAVEAKIIEHHVDPVSKCGKKVSWLMKEIIELNRKAMPYL
ncbi:hypothetical protein F3Y22_tig00000538pilonHSYRG00072 [Hibiscus syriacus]|uniref:J domain-containing protein n=1 Tax=Hibiscus syriacus TaxID=106335 RepID=A0A6A3D6Y0_HIBSY|nr:hypothetical protein F3Y22_tig00000538pilonHSYRG00072 [Hibiscus syriacus]